jgi:hypothetical protein
MPFLGLRLLGGKIYQEEPIEVQIQIYGDAFGFNPVNSYDRFAILYFQSFLRPPHLDCNQLFHYTIPYEPT